MEYMDQNQGRQEETHYLTHRFRRLFLDLLSMGWGGCTSAMGVIKNPILLFYSEIHYVINLYITTKRVRSFLVSIISNSAILPLQRDCFATADRGSIIVWIHRWSVMNYGSLQAVFMETKYISHIHRFGTSIFGKLVVDTSKSMNNNNQIFWKL